MLSGSRASGPAIARSISAASRTVRDIGPGCEVAAHGSAWGALPSDGLKPTIPQNEAGMRIEPAPSVPWASGPNPDATAAAAPADDPPEVRSNFQGLRQGSASRLLLPFLLPKWGVL